MDDAQVSPVELKQFDFINGAWFAKQIRQSKVGTAVDQWGWDSKEMWLPFLKDEELMDNLATFWARPLAMGYLPPQYRADLAGGRLIALSKHPKERIRHIFMITDALRRLVAKGSYHVLQRFFCFKFCV